MKHLKKVYRWSFRKFFINMLILASVIGTGIFCLSLTANATQNHKFETVTVHTGDTLWSIAASIAPNRDPRRTVDRLKCLNHLDDSDLKPGQNLKIEIYD